MDYKFKPNIRSKNIRIKIKTDGDVVVTAHPLVPKRLVQDFVVKNEAWIRSKRAEITENLHGLTSVRDKLWFLGSEFDFRLQVASSIKEGVRIDGTKMIVLSKSEEHDEVRRVLTAWYKKEAKKHLTDRTHTLALHTNNRAISISIRSQSTRWGSCSSRRTISLNWRLIMTPPFVIDYIIYHELAHLTHMNHSKQFWSLVENYCPDYKKAERWLKQNHKLLNY